MSQGYRSPTLCGNGRCNDPFVSLARRQRQTFATRWRRTIVAENLLLKQQLLLHNRSRSRAPNLSTLDRVLPGFWTLFLNPMNLAFGLDLDKDVVRRILAASWQFTTAPNKGRPDRHGSPRSVTRKLACGAWTCFAANRSVRRPGC